MKTIYQYPIEVTDVSSVMLPEGAKILSVGVDGRDPCIWALIDTDKPPLPRFLVTYGTGHNMKILEDLRYIGTYTLQNGNLVFHLFESLKPLDVQAKITCATCGGDGCWQCDGKGYYYR